MELNLTDDCKFHSVFVCPILKVEVSKENPPMMMACGHVICKEGLLRLSRGDSRYGGILNRPIVHARIGYACTMLDPLNN